MQFIYLLWRSNTLYIPEPAPFVLIGAEALDEQTQMLAAAIKSRRSCMFAQHQHHVSV